MVKNPEKSRKSYDTNQQQEQQLDIPPIFVDRDLDSPVFVNRLREEDIRIDHVSGNLEVVPHNEYYQHDAERVEDEEWIEVVGDNKWIAFTKDKRIRNRETAIESVRTHKARLFNLRTNLHLTAGQNAEAFILAMPRISRFLKKNKPPFIAKVSKDGKVEMLTDLSR